MLFLCMECGKNLDESDYYRKFKNKCEICLNKKRQMSSMWKVFHKKRLTTRIDSEPENKSNSKMLEKPKIENVNTDNNNRTLLVGPSFSGKIFLVYYIFLQTPD